MVAKLRATKTHSALAATALIVIFAVLFVVGCSGVSAANWGDVRITEVLYNESGGDSHTYEFVEICNMKNEGLNLSNWSLTDTNQNDSISINLSANECFVMAKNQEALNNTSEVNGALTCQVINNTYFQLKDGGETLYLYDDESNLIDYFNYTGSSTGKNYGLEKIFVSGWNDLSNWQQSESLFGTPCSPNSVSNKTISTNSTSCGINLEQNLSTQNYYRAGETFNATAGFLTGGFWNPLNVFFGSNLSTNLSLSATNNSNHTPFTFSNVNTTNQSNQTLWSFIISNVTNGTYNLTHTLLNLVYWRDNNDSCSFVYANSSCSNCTCQMSLNFTVLKTLNASITIETNNKIYSNNTNETICIDESESYIKNSEYSNTYLTGNVRYYIANTTYSNANLTYVNLSSNTNETINSTVCFNASNLSTGSYELCAEVYDNATNITKEDTFGRQIRNCTSFLVGTYNYTLNLTNSTAICGSNSSGNLTLTINLSDNSMNITDGVAFLICSVDSSTNITTNQSFNATNGSSTNVTFNVSVNNSTSYNSTCWAFIQIQGVNLTNNITTLNLAGCSVSPVSSSTYNQTNSGSSSISSVNKKTCSFINSTNYVKVDGYYLVNVSDPQFNFYGRSSYYTLNSSCTNNLSFENSTVKLSLQKEGNCTVKAEPKNTVDASPCYLYLTYEKPACEFNISLFNVSTIEQNGTTTRVVVTLRANNCNGSATLKLNASTWNFSSNETTIYLNVGEEKNITFNVSGAGVNGTQASVSLFVNGTKRDEKFVNLTNKQQLNNNTTITSLFLGNTKCDYSWLWFIFFIASAVFLGLGYRIFRDESILSGIYARRILLFGAVAILLAIVGFFTLNSCNGWFEGILLFLEMVGNVIFMLYIIRISKLFYDKFA